MVRPDTVLVLTQWMDPTADLVIHELNQRGVPLIRLDPGAFPQALSVAAVLDGGRWHGTLRLPDRSVDLTRIRSAYYRRPSSFQFPEGMSRPDRDWATRQARLGLGGLLAGLPCWLNHPGRIAQAAFKPVQLQVARDCGLRVPQSLLTNDPKQARLFAEGIGRVVTKPLTGTGVVEGGRHQVLYTAVVSPEECGDPTVRHTMHLFQEWVDKAFEVRLTAVDGRCFAAAIHAGSDQARVDWRSNYAALSYKVVDTPAGVRAGVMAMLARLGLRFGAFDFAVTPAGEWVLLELNPNGQWAWIEQATGLPIAAAIADALQRGTDR